MNLNMDDDSSLVLREIYCATKDDDSSWISHKNLYNCCFKYRNIDYFNEFNQAIRNLLAYNLIVKNGYDNPDFRISSEGIEYIEKTC